MSNIFVFKFIKLTWEHINACMNQILPCPSCLRSHWLSTSLESFQKNVCHSQKHTLISCWLRACCHSNGLLGCLVFSRLIGEQRKQLTRLYYNHRVTMAWWIVFWTLGWGGVQPLLGVGRDDMICVVFLVFRVLGQLLKVNVKWWWASGLPTAYVQYDIGLA